MKKFRENVMEKIDVMEKMLLAQCESDVGKKEMKAYKDFEKNFEKTF